MNCFEDTIRKWPELWRCLGNAVSKNRLGHAFLISSDRSAAREDFATALAALSCCPSGKSTGKPCGSCTVCRQLKDGIYPELHHVTPAGKSYQIQIGDRINPEPNTVRYFEEQFFLTSTSGVSRKVGIIHDADRMNSESQNALLKTLEEPPPDTMIILTTGNPVSLLPTTRSRCQHLQLLENHIDFDFAGAGELFDALNALVTRCRGDIIQAETQAMRIISLAGNLREAAEDRAEAAWGEKIAKVREFDQALAKRMDKQQQDTASGEYMRLRKDFLAAIHTYCAQLYLLSRKAELNELPNPEIMNIPAGNIPDASCAGQILAQSEELLFNLRFNVNEELALRNFAIQCAMA